MQTLVQSLRWLVVHAHRAVELSGWVEWIIAVDLDRSCFLRHGEVWIECFELSVCFIVSKSLENRLICFNTCVPGSSWGQTIEISALGAVSCIFVTFDNSVDVWLYLDDCEARVQLLEHLLVIAGCGRVLFCSEVFVLARALNCFLVALHGRVAVDRPVH